MLPLPRPSCFSGARRPPAGRRQAGAPLQTAPAQRNACLVSHLLFTPWVSLGPSTQNKTAQADRCPNWCRFGGTHCPPQVSLCPWGRGHVGVPTSGPARFSFSRLRSAGSGGKSQQRARGPGYAGLMRTVAGVCPGRVQAAGSEGFTTSLVNTAPEPVWWGKAPPVDPEA